jgi:hypothetical protein
MGQVTRGYAAAATALLLLSGASSFGELLTYPLPIWCVEHYSMTCKEMSCQASIMCMKSDRRDNTMPIETAWRSYPDGRGESMKMWSTSCVFQKCWHMLSQKVKDIRIGVSCILNGYAAQIPSKECLFVVFFHSSSSWMKCFFMLLLKTITSNLLTYIIHRSFKIICVSHNNIK